MDPKSRSRHEARAKIFKALAQCVCELQEMIGADISTVSKRLAQLKTAGVVAGDKRGAQV